MEAKYTYYLVLFSIEIEAKMQDNYQNLTAAEQQLKEKQLQADGRAFLEQKRKEKGTTEAAIEPPPPPSSSQPKAAIPKKQHNGLEAYAVVTQVVFLIAVPILLFVVGGTWLIDKYNLPKELKIVAVLLGLIFMVGCLASYLWKYIIAHKHKELPPALLNDRRDTDYYDPSIKKKHL